MSCRCCLLSLALHATFILLILCAGFLFIAINSEDFSRHWTICATFVFVILLLTLAICSRKNRRKGGENQDLEKGIEEESTFEDDLPPSYEDVVGKTNRK